MITLLKRLFNVNNMLKPQQRLGEIPSTSSMYLSTYRIAWPSALEAVLISLIGSVDTIMVSSLGPGAIAAVGITNQPKYIVMSVIFSLNLGVTAIVARRKGEKDIMGANRCLKQSIMLSSMLTVAASALGYIFADPLIILAGAGRDIITDASVYFRIIMIGNVFYCIGLTITAAQRGSGNTRISMVTNLTANLVNICFDYLLIGGRFGFPALGVAGAAIATAIGNIVSLIIAVFSVTRRGGFLSLLEYGEWRFDLKTLKNLASLGSSALVEQVFMRIGFFSYAAIVAGLGTIAFATHQICMNVINVSFAFGDGLSIAASSLVGQSLGAKRPDIAILYGKVTQRIAFCVSAVLFVVFMLGRHGIVSLFTDDNQIIALGAVILIVIACTSPFQTSNVVVSGCLRGAGDAKYVALVSFISIGVIRPVVTWLLCFPLGLGLLGAWFSLMFDQVTRLTLNYLRFSRGKWTKIKI
ncbi:MATE family efflux transporter [Acetanaerobacterium elongatum]|uniref:Probable multidrug resistance protein NorM n=1 Tax=Acetanaerobacterium elongatum TaxID=258515 RepID=A0A1G9YRV0_9FIRM|nr:MATE family efflux transporter [Acetanaerobacterium elongatum]SDN11116.1 putative efflux protein, MATE family [Acetanaerobacterium elongatum]